MPWSDTTKVVWITVVAYIVAAILSLGFWAVVIYYGIKLAKKAWGA